MRLERTHHEFSPSDFSLDNNGFTIIDYMELIGTPEDRLMSNYERIQEVYRTLDEIRRRYNITSSFNENRFTME